MTPIEFLILGIISGTIAALIADTIRVGVRATVGRAF